MEARIRIHPYAYLIHPYAYLVFDRLLVGPLRELLEQSLNVVFGLEQARHAAKLIVPDRGSGGFQ